MIDVLAIDSKIRPARVIFKCCVYYRQKRRSAAVDVTELMADGHPKTTNASLAETDSYRKNREVTLSVTHTHHALESSG